MKNTKQAEQAYLGDGVYAEFDGYQIRLTTRGWNDLVSNEIFLEPSVLGALIIFFEKVRMPVIPAAETEITP